MDPVEHVAPRRGVGLHRGVGAITRVDEPQVTVGQVDRGAVPGDLHRGPTGRAQLRAGDVVDRDVEAVGACLLSLGRLHDEVVAVQRDHVGAGLVEPGPGPGGEVAAAGAGVAVHQVVEAGVGEGEAAEVVAQALHEGFLTDVGDELVEHALALDVGDGVEVGHRLRDVGDVAADGVARGAHVHLVGRALAGDEEGGPLVGELGGRGHAPVGGPRRERLVEPEVVPPLHRHQVAEPHVRHLVEDELGAGRALRVRRGSAEELAVAVGDAAPVLHRAAEVGDEDLVVALLRERRGEALAEEGQALAGEGDHLVEVALELGDERLAAVEAEVVAVVLLGAPRGTGRR